jgi:hypothetical protein
MIRTQVLLTEDQDRALEQLSARTQFSKAALVREAVDLLLTQRLHNPARAEARARALAAAGRFSSGLRDVAERHDEYLAEDFDHR